MKKIMIAVVLSCFVVSMAYAIPKENCGCGLGSMVMQDKEGLVFEIFAVTTNGTSSNNTFGITSGTLGCKKPAKIAYIEKLNIFVAQNMDNLAVDIAAGQGETLQALAEVAEVPVEKRAQFYNTLQSNFDGIYPDENITHKDVVDSITTLINHI